MMQLDLVGPPTIACARCGAPCQLAPTETDRPEIAILRGKSRAGGQGVCASCNVTAFLQDPDIPTSFILGGMDPRRRAAALRLPHLQEQFVAVVNAQRGGGIDPRTVDWERVIRNWSLPHPPGTFGSKRRYREAAELSSKEVNG